MLGFCEDCHEQMSYFIKEEKKHKNIKGKNIEYMGKTAYCDLCENEIFISDIRDYNLKMLDKAYREEEGLISQEEIDLILTKYDVGKRPLSLLLGWGEGTVTRYLDGDIPTKQYSNILKKILKQSGYMNELVEKNKDRITKLAYKRICDALENNTASIVNSTDEKIEHVVKYILVNSEEITPLALQKQLYFAQGFFTAFTGEYLFNNNCEAWLHGPVYRSVYYKYKDYGYNPIKDKDYEYGPIQLSAVERELLDSIIRNFGCYSGKILEKMTHAEQPWRRARSGIKDNKTSDMIINKEDISGYFNEIKLKHGMFNICDIRDYSRDLFEKLYN